MCDHLQDKRSGVPPLIARVLTDDDHYGDGPPTWTNARSSKGVRKARKSYVKRLRRFARQFPEAKKLAKILARCKRRRRCMSGACPECGRAFQRWFVSQVVELGGNVDPGELKSISIIFQKHRTAEDQLTALDTIGMKRSLSQTVKDADGLKFVAGAIDLSLNDDRQKKQGIAWQPQFYGLTDVTNVEALSNLLRSTYSPTKTAPRPVQLKKCDGSTKVISYAFKTDFVRRIAYRAEIGPPDRRRKCWQTRKVSLRASEHVQAMLWMHKIGLAGRLFLRGVRMTRTGNGVGLVQIKKLE
jgi:hypothetical protein